MIRVSLVLAFMLGCAGAAPAPSVDNAAARDRTWAATPIAADPEVVTALVVVEQYRQAIKRGDTATLLALAAPSYHDDAGTPGADDDIDRAGLATALARWSQLDLVVLDLEVRSFAHQDSALVLEVHYAATIVIDGRRSSITEVHQMRLARSADGALRFTSGM